MSNKLSVFGIALLLIICASSASALTLAARFQTPADQTAPPRRRELGLTEEQRTQLRTIHQSARAQLHVIRSDQALTSELRHEKARAVHERTRQQVKSVLTPEQQELIKNLPGRDPRERRDYVGQRENISEVLSLTPEQRSQIRTLRQGARTQRNEIRNDTTLSQEQRADQLRMLQQSTRQQISSILTPQQREKIHERPRMEDGVRGGRRGGLFRPKREL